MSPAKRNPKAPKGGKSKTSSLPPKRLSPDSIAKQLADSDAEDVIPDAVAMEHREVEREEVNPATPLDW